MSTQSCSLAALIATDYLHACEPALQSSFNIYWATTNGLCCSPLFLLEWEVVGLVVSQGTLPSACFVIIQVATPVLGHGLSVLHVGSQGVATWMGR